VVGAKLGTVSCPTTGDRRSRTRPLLAAIYSDFLIFPREELGASTATTRYIATQARRRVPQDRDTVSGGPFVFVSALAFLGNSKTSVADMNNETPTPAKPERIFPVLAAIAPIAYGPANAPRFPTELIKAIPAAAENPVRNSLGIDQKGP